MQHRFLSKAKLLGEDRWVEGYYIRYGTRQLSPIGDELKDDEVIHLIVNDGFADWNMPRQLEFHKIDVSTLCQSTGIIGKNNKLVFENDIVIAYSQGEKRTLTVKLRNSGVPMFILYPAYHNGEYWNFFVHDDNDRMVDNVEVIGNIFDQNK